MYSVKYTHNCSFWSVILNQFPSKMNGKGPWPRYNTCINHCRLSNIKSVVRLDLFFIIVRLFFKSGMLNWLNKFYLINYITVKLSRSSCLHYIRLKYYHRSLELDWNSNLKSTSCEHHVYPHKQWSKVDNSAPTPVVFTKNHRTANILI